MIARCIQCGHGHDLRPMNGKKLENFHCENCGNSLEAADLRWCVACGKTTEDIHIMPPMKLGGVEISVTLPNVQIPAIRYFVKPGTTHCPQGHPFRSIERKIDN